MTMPGRVPSLVRSFTAEEIEVAESAERARQRQARIDALSIDRSRFDGHLLDQMSRHVAAGFAEEERLIARRRERVTVSRTEALRRLTAKPSLWRRVVWGER